MTDEEINALPVNYECPECKKLYPTVIHTCMQCCKIIGISKGYDYKYPSVQYCHECNQSIGSNHNELYKKYDRILKFTKNLALLSLSKEEIEDLFLIEDTDSFDNSKMDYFDLGRQSNEAGVALEARNVLIGVNQ